MTDKPLAFLDTEFTNLSHTKRIWEVGLITRTPVKRTEHVFQIKDVDLTHADLKSLEIGGFFDRYEGYKGTPRGKVYTEHEACVQIMQLTRGAHIVGGVPNADTEAIERMMCRNGLRSSWHYHLMDFENLIVGYIRGLQQVESLLAQDFGASEELLNYDCSPPWHSEELSRLIGVEPPSESERHTALGDALWAERVYDKVMGIN